MAYGDKVYLKPKPRPAPKFGLQAKRRARMNGVEVEEPEVIEEYGVDEPEEGDLSELEKRKAEFILKRKLLKK